MRSCTVRCSEGVGWGGNDVRCYLQTKMVVLRWMMNVFGSGGGVGWGGVMTFVVTCKQR